MDAYTGVQMLSLWLVSVACFLRGSGGCGSDVLLQRRPRLLLRQRRRVIAAADRAAEEDERRRPLRRCQFRQRAIGVGRGPSGDTIEKQKQNSTHRKNKTKQNTRSLVALVQREIGMDWLGKSRFIGTSHSDKIRQSDRDSRGSISLDMNASVVMR